MSSSAPSSSPQRLAEPGHAVLRIAEPGHVGASARRSLMPAESGAVARSKRHWPLVAVVVGIGAGLAIAILSADRWRLGCVVVGCSLVVGAIERLVLPRNEAGLLQVRSKPFDVVVLLLAGVAVVALAILVPSGR
jgi:uncharacterized membrane protein